MGGGGAYQLPLLLWISIIFNNINNLADKSEAWAYPHSTSSPLRIETLLQLYPKYIDFN